MDLAVTGDQGRIALAQELIALADLVATRPGVLPAQLGCPVDGRQL